MSGRSENGTNRENGSKTSKTLNAEGERESILGIIKCEEEIKRKFEGLSRFKTDEDIWNREQLTPANEKT